MSASLSARTASLVTNNVCGVCGTYTREEDQRDCARCPNLVCADCIAHHGDGALCLPCDDGAKREAEGWYRTREALQGTSHPDAPADPLGASIAHRHAESA